MPRSGTQQQAAASAESTASSDTDKMPTTDGSSLALAQWLRDLEAAQHLFDSDVAYFLVTASAIASNCKTAVLSREHSKLLLLNEVQRQNYSVLNPPPVADSFLAAYTSTRDGINEGVITHIAAADVPTPPPALPDHHVLAPDRIVQLDMKLRNNLLNLITSKGRRRHYQELSLSGCELLRRFARDARASVSQYVQSPHTRKLKAQLNELKKVKLTQISMVEFNEVRDSIEEINDQLEADDQLSDIQLCDHYIWLLHGLNSHGLNLALEVKLTSNKVTGDKPRVMSI